MRPTRRTRLRLVLLAVLSLLFQQVALASYACLATDVPAADAAMMAHCADMAMADSHAPASTPSALCPVHCVDQALATQDAHAPTVPPVAMPALLPAPIVLVTLPTVHVTYDHAMAWRRSGIPPTLRFRVLLI